MAFGNMVNAVRRTVTQRTTPPNTANIIDASGSGDEVIIPKVAAQRKDISYTDSEIKGFVPSERSFASRNTTSNPAHGSIIKNIASQSNISQQSGGNTTWQECRHLKKSDFGKEYCTEYHSLCAKERCNRARK